ncbi:MAG: transcriptional regulator [Acidobacteriota bacterium]|nr:transcriptional regulator [Acidobacteriota bacterium]
MVHEPARLAILMVLSGAEWVEFKLLEELTRLTKGNLSSHLAKLEDAGYVVIKKGYRGKIPLTTAALTTGGRKALAEHWERLKRAAPPTRQG